MSSHQPCNHRRVLPGQQQGAGLDAPREQPSFAMAKAIVPARRQHGARKRDCLKRDGQSRDRCWRAASAYEIRKSSLCAFPPLVAAAIQGSSRSRASADGPPRVLGEGSCRKIQKLSRGRQHRPRKLRNSLAYRRRATWCRLRRCKQEIVMTKVVFVLVTLAVVGTVAAPATAFDARSFFEQQERQSGN